ncbi:MAG TPA: helix-turn-helix domain-containing protein [Mycobacteriales bacterium]|nr:helix-turn-helix domain-containing protein [Mycobacteriales bacterium]
MDARGWPSSGVGTLGLELLGDLSRLTDRLVQEIQRDDGRYEAERVADTDLWGSCHDNLARVLQTLTGTVPAGADPWDAPRATGRRRAQQGMPLESVLHAYRLGGRIIWESLVEAGRRNPKVDVLTLLDGATGVWEVVDRFSSAVSDAYRATETELAQRLGHRQQALLDALVEGHGRDVAVSAEAARALELPESGGYLVVTAAYDPATADLPRSPRDALAVRGLRSAWRIRADREVGIVAVGPAGAAATVDLLRRLVPGRAGISSEVAGLAEIGQGYRLAETALRTLAPGERGVAWLDDRLPEALVVGSPELSGRLARQTFGDLLDLPRPEREVLLGTLDAWFAAGGSPTRAAERLYCHRNTVLNRLRRVESLIGRPLATTRSNVGYALALMALRLLDPPQPAAG